MLNKDKIKDLINKVEDKDFANFKDIIMKDVSDDVDVAVQNYVDSGDAFDSFKNSRRFTNEANLDLNDVALEYYKKYKKNRNKIQKALEDDGYDLKEIATVMKYIKEI